MNKLRKNLCCFILITIVLSQITAGTFASTINGNPDGQSLIPEEAKQEDISNPDQIVGTGTPESCTSEAFIQAVAKGGTIVFNGGSEPFTITLDEPAKIFNNENPDVVIDGGGLVTLSGDNKTRILYMNTCNQDQVWTTSHAQNQDHPRLTVQNITFANGNSSSETEYEGGGAIWVRGGRFKVVNCRFINNICASTGPDVGGGAIRVFDQYEDLPVYVINSTFGGAEGLGNIGSNGGAISSIGVSWTIINSIFSYNEAIGNGANPGKAGTPGSGSGGAIYNDGNEMTLSIAGSRIEKNKVNAHGSGIFFVTNNHTGDIKLHNTIIENNIGGSWYPSIANISMHSGTKVTVTNTNTQEKEPIIDTNQANELTASPILSKVIVDNKAVQFEAYNIDNNNYFKLRDIGKVLSGTSKKFEIGWDESSKVITLLSGKTYSETGGELWLSNNSKSKSCKLAELNIVLDGRIIKLTAYNIDNYNYIKLRDIAKEINFGVSWDGAANKITIDSNTSYEK